MRNYFAPGVFIAAVAKAAYELTALVSATVKADKKQLLLRPGAGAVGTAQIFSIGRAPV